MKLATIGRESRRSIFHFCNADFMNESNGIDQGVPESFSIHSEEGSDWET
jgi:hypothetical protein